MLDAMPCHALPCHAFLGLSRQSGTIHQQGYGTLSPVRELELEPPTDGTMEKEASSQEQVNKTCLIQQVSTRACQSDHSPPYSANSHETCSSQTLRR
jgi:hypothetical protein